MNEGIFNQHDASGDDLSLVESLLDRAGAHERAGADEQRLLRIAQATCPVRHARSDAISLESARARHSSRSAVLTPLRLAAALGIAGTVALSIVATRGRSLTPQAQSPVIASHDAESISPSDAASVLDLLDEYFSPATSELASLTQRTVEFESGLIGTIWDIEEGDSL